VVSEAMGDRDEGFMGLQKRQLELQEGKHQDRRSDRRREALNALPAPEAMDRLRFTTASPYEMLIRQAEERHDRLMEGQGEQGVPATRPPYFNTVAATMRYQIEQATGIFKSRWTILHGMPLRLRTTYDQALTHDFIVACVILHDLVFNTNDKPLDDNEYANGKARHAARTGQAEMSADELCVSKHLQRRERRGTEVKSIAMEDDKDFDLDDYEVW